MNLPINAIAAWFLVVLMSASTLVFAQTSPQPAAENIRGGQGYFMISTNILDLDEFNTGLRQNGYPDFSGDLFSVGLGGHSTVNRFILGMEGHALMTGKKNFTRANRNYQRSLEAAYGFLNIGYQVIRHAGFSLYPLFGLGGGGVMLKITDRTTTAFDDVLANPGRSAQLRTSGFLFHAALGFDYLVATRRSENRTSGLVLGLRAGFAFAPHNGTWHLEESKISGGPEIGVTGPYIRLLLGGGSKQNK